MNLCCVYVLGLFNKVYSPVSLGRKAIGIELKDSYYKQMVVNLNGAENRFKKVNQPTLFD